jgi:hypothetical protein
MSDLVIKANPEQWLEVKHNGTIYYVAISSLLRAYDKEQNDD